MYVLSHLCRVSFYSILSLHSYAVKNKEPCSINLKDFLYFYEIKNISFHLQLRTIFILKRTFQDAQ